ncbi:hypothetical protein FKM82_014199 [Ascaphus truei]
MAHARKPPSETHIFLYLESHPKQPKCRDPLNPIHSNQDKK